MVRRSRRRVWPAPRRDLAADRADRVRLPILWADAGGRGRQFGRASRTARHGAPTPVLDSLTTRTGLSVKGGAPQIVRSAAQNLRAAKPLAHVGQLARRQARRGALRHVARGDRPADPPGGDGSAGPDSSLREFVKTIARSEMLVRAAEARHIGLTGCRSATASAGALSQRAPDDGHRHGPRARIARRRHQRRGATRQQVAARRVDAYLPRSTGARPAPQF